MQISILGCGWLGLPLAKALAQDGLKVKGSTTTESKVAILKEYGIRPYIIAAEAEGWKGNVDGFLEASEILVINIPPKAKSGESYPEKMKSLVPYIEQSGISKVLFVSSTSVYADDNEIVTEDTLPNPDTESGRQVLEAERVLQGNTTFKTTVLRFGGLIGGERHPVYHLAGRQNIASPDTPVNLIHRDDCIGIIKAIIDKDVWGEVFNGVAPNHPTRVAYYTAKAIELGLTVPGFEEPGTKAGKTVTSDKTETILGYNFTQVL